MRQKAGWMAVGVLAAGLTAVPGLAQQTTTVPKPVVNPNLPKDAQASQFISRAEFFQAQRKYPEAAAFLQAAAELLADDGQLWDRAGWAHIDAGNPTAALPDFDRAAKIAPAGTTLLGGTLIANYLLGRTKEVEDLLTKIAAPERREALLAAAKAGIAKPRSAESSFALGLLYARALNYSPRGVAPLEAAVKAQPSLADGWLLLYELNAALDRGPQADQAAIKYLGLKPDSPDAFRIRAERYVEKEELDDAIAEIQAGIAKHPTAPELYYQLARVQENFGAPKDALATLDKLVQAAVAKKDETLRLQARTQVAALYIRQNNFIEAEKHYREIAARPEASTSTLGQWASLLTLTAKWPEAAQTYAKIAAREESERGMTSAGKEDALAARFRAALSSLAQGDKATAEKALQDALKSPGDSRTSPEMEARAFQTWLGGKAAKLGPLAYLKSDERWAAFVWRKESLEEGEFEVRGRFSPAARAWRAALQAVQKKHPDCWAADYSLARVYAAGGFSDPAVQLLRKVTRARVDWWAPHFALGQRYVEKREKDAALEELRQVLKLAPGCRQAKVYVSLLNNLKEEDEE